MWITGESLPYGKNELEIANLTERDAKSGEVVYISVKENMIKDGVLDVVKAKPLLHDSGDIFVVGDNLRKVDD